MSHIADDLFVYGTDLKEYDKNLHAVLQRLREKGFTLNSAQVSIQNGKAYLFWTCIK